MMIFFLLLYVCHEPVLDVTMCTEKPFGAVASGATSDDVIDSADVFDFAT
jgi:hypothetical protein